MIGGWRPDMIRLMRDAAEREPFYEALAAEMARRLPAGAHVCDAGCGLGYLALQLARRGFPVTAVDLSADALSVLRENCAAEGLPVRILHGDIHVLAQDAPYDAMAFCLFGGLDQILHLAACQCCGDVLIAARDYDTHRFTPGARRCRRESLADMTRTLREKGIPFGVKKMSLSFGQPFKSIEDARLFFTLYSHGEPVTEAFMDSRIVKTQDAEYPYYMPHTRDIGLVHIRAEDIRAAGGKTDETDI